MQPLYDKFYEANIDERKVEGDSTESGVLKFYENIENIKFIRDQFPQVVKGRDEIKVPFNSKDKYSCYMREVKESHLKEENNYWLAFKGAPEYIIKRCSRYIFNGKEMPINESFKNSFVGANKAFALMGERVMGFAYLKLDKNEFPEGFDFENNLNKNSEDKNAPVVPNYPTTGLCFVGLIALEDPPRYVN